jgi:four helix bundle protein
MKTYSFERLNAWQESRLLVKHIYKLTAEFPSHEKFGLVSQIRRAAVSVSSNIAEGSGRNSIADQKHFYRIAFSSLMEVLNQAILSVDLDYIEDEQLKQIRIQIDKTAQLISGLAKS